MASMPACAWQNCYNGYQPSYGCNFIDTACYCKQSVATQLVSCAQGNCDQNDLQSYIRWAQEACAAVGVSFDASASSTIATKASATFLATSTSSDNGSPSSSGLSTAAVGVSFDASASSTIATTASATFLATSTSSDNGSPSSSGLSTSDKIAIGIGVPAGVAAILSAWFAYKALHRRK